MFGGDGGGEYWGQWNSKYGPMPSSRQQMFRPRHQSDLFAPAPYTAPRPFNRSTPLLPLPPPTAFSSDRNVPLYYDFNAPARPALLSIRCAVQSIRADIQWSAPRVGKNVNFMYRLKLSGGSKGETVTEYPPWKNSIFIPLEPGTYYTIVVEAVSGNRVLAAGDLPFKSVLCTAEIALLQNRAISFLQNIASVNQMQEIFIFYRNKPVDYWRKIKDADAIMRPYLKDANGNPGCPINNEINGLFFSARLHQGLLPTSSPFGGQRLKIVCQRLFLPDQHHLYFCDFYCNTTVHYVTLVICLPNTMVDQYCADKLLRIDPFDNMFMQVSIDNFNNYRYFVNNQIWVELYYTADVPLWWGEFDYTVSLGQSKPNGVPNNKFCKICNLYPLESESENESSSNRKRSLTDDDDDALKNDSERTKRNKIYVDVPRTLSTVNDEDTTFSLALDTVKNMAASEEKDNKNFDEIKAYLVEVVCHLVDETVKSCTDFASEKRPESPPAMLKICLPSECPVDEGYSSPLIEASLSFLKDLDEKASSSISVGSSSETVSLSEVKSRADEYDLKMKKLFENLNSIKNSIRNLDKKLAAYR